MLLYGGALLIGYLLDEQSAKLRAEAESEKRRLKRIKARRSRIAPEGRRRASRLTIAAMRETVRIVKEERRAAAQARDRLPWGSPAREKAHELVLSLGKRLDEFYARRQRFYNNAPRP